MKITITYYNGSKYLFKNHEKKKMIHVNNIPKREIGIFYKICQVYFSFFGPK